MTSKEVTLVNRTQPLGLLCLSQCFFELGFGLFHLNDKKVNKKQEHNVNIGWLLSVPNLYILTTICAVG